MTETKVLNTHWGASRDEVEESMEAVGWKYGSTPDRDSVHYTGTLFKREVLLICNFTLAYPETEPKLQRIEFVFFRPESWLYGLVLKVLKEKYKDPERGGFYNDPTWVIDGGETAIQLRVRPEPASLHVIMSYNGEGAEDRKIDYFQEAVDKM